MEVVLTERWQFLSLALAAIGEALVTWRDPFRGAAMILAMLPAYLMRVRLAGLPPTNALELFLLAFAATAMLRSGIVAHRAHIRRSLGKAAWPFALILLGATLSAAVGLRGIGEPRVILGAWKGFIVEPMLFVATVAFLLSRARDAAASSDRLMQAYVLSAVAVAGLSILGAAVRSPSLPFTTYDGRLRGLFASPNQLAMYLLPALFLLQRASERRRPVAGTILLALALLSTRSSGAWLGALAGLSILAALRRWPRRAGSLLRFGGIASVVVGVLLPFLAVHFSSVLVAEGERSSLASRLTIWRVSEDLLRQKWLFGIGPGAFERNYLALQPNYPPYLEWAVPQPHNLALAFWLQGGILGFLGFAWLVALAFRSAPSAPAELLAASGAIIVHGFVDTPAFTNALSMLFFFLFFSAARDTREPREGSRAVAGVDGTESMA